LQGLTKGFAACILLKPILKPILTHPCAAAGGLQGQPQSKSQRAPRASNLRFCFLSCEGRSAPGSAACWWQCE
jgi:hypothetical protein